MNVLAHPVCTASFGFDRAAGNYEMDVQYFDQNNGESKFRILSATGRWMNGSLAITFLRRDREATLPLAAEFLG